MQKKQNGVSVSFCCFAPKKVFDTVFCFWKNVE